MSMVGYLLGLGDRHPSNLMLDRYSGKLLHIDFGDCFEASMNREKFPEKVPFRLTRMMVPISVQIFPNVLSLFKKANLIAITPVKHNPKTLPLHPRAEHGKKSPARILSYNCFPQSSEYCR